MWLFESGLDFAFVAVVDKRPAGPDVESGTAIGLFGVFLVHLALMKIVSYNSNAKAVREGVLLLVALKETGDFLK